MRHQGFLVALEGADGAGRTTQTERLLTWLREEGHDAYAFRLKGSGLMRERLRRLQRRMDISERALFLLYAADLADILHYEVLPVLREGRVVLFDRYMDTPVARAVVHGVNAAWARRVLAFAPPPDATFLLKASAECRIERLLDRRRFLQARETGYPTSDAPVLERAVHYQRRLAAVLDEETPEAIAVDAERPALAVQEELQGHLSKWLSREG